MNAMGSMMSMGGGRMPDMSQMRERMFQKADGNGDQALSLDEFKAAGKNMPGGGSDRAGRAEQAFGKMDADGNGSVTQEEMRASGDRMSSEMRGTLIDLQSMLSGMLGGQGGAQGAGQPDPAALFGKADEDGNGSMSREEFDRSTRDSPMARMMSRAGGGEDPFKKMDSDGDGAVNREEFDAFGENMRREMSSRGGAGMSSMMQQANQAYGQNGTSTSSADLTNSLLKALSGRESQTSRVA
jgi:Ca2+-binding EF-hand superfamily protein